jgi:hypothetical protein
LLRQNLSIVGARDLSKLEGPFFNQRITRSSHLGASIADTSAAPAGGLSFFIANVAASGSRSILS